MREGKTKSGDGDGDAAIDFGEESVDSEENDRLRGGVGLRFKSLSSAAISDSERDDGDTKVSLPPEQGVRVQLLVPPRGLKMTRGRNLGLGVEGRDA